MNYDTATNRLETVTGDDTNTCPTVSYGLGNAQHDSADRQRTLVARRLAIWFVSCACPYHPLCQRNFRVALVGSYATVGRSPKPRLAKTAHGATDLLVAFQFWTRYISGHITLPESRAYRCYETRTKQLHGNYHSDLSADV